MPRNKHYHGATSQARAQSRYTKKNGIRGIAVTHAVHDRLDRLRRYGETYNQLIIRLLDEHDEHNEVEYAQNL